MGSSFSYFLKRGSPFLDKIPNIILIIRVNRYELINSALAFVGTQLNKAHKKIQPSTTLEYYEPHNIHM